VDVDVDAGRIALEGQMLLWHYDVPETGQRTYKLMVQKRNAHIGAHERSGTGFGCAVM